MEYLILVSFLCHHSHTFVPILSFRSHSHTISQISFPYYHSGLIPILCSHTIIQVSFPYYQSDLIPILSFRSHSHTMFPFSFRSHSHVISQASFPCYQSGLIPMLSARPHSHAISQASFPCYQPGLIPTLSARPHSHAISQASFSHYKFITVCSIYDCALTDCLPRIWFWFIPSSTNPQGEGPTIGNVVYGAAILLGAGASTLLVTSLSMVADLIGCTVVCVCVHI